MKRNILSILIIASFLIGGFFTASFADADTTVKKTYRFTFATQMPIGHLVSRSGDLIAKRAGELSGGKIKIKHFAGGTLFKDKEIPEAVMSGGCSLGIATSSRWAGHVSGLHMWEVPFLYTSKKQVETVADKVIPIFDKALYSKGAKLLGFVYYGDADGIGNAKKPLYKPTDLGGLKMRSFSAIASASLEAAGGTPVVMSSAEVYTAIQRGTIDGAISGTTTFVVRKWMEVVKHITVLRGMVGYPALPFTMAVNRNSWENMEPAAQKIMMQVAKEAWRYSGEQVMEETDKAIKTLKEQANLKVQVIPFGSAQWKEWRKVMAKPAMAKFMSVGGDMGREVLSVVKEYE
jgi:C4-dicarboxylate-binding protein DctP